MLLGALDDVSLKFETKSLKLLRMSSSLELVASFKLTKSVALSLLRLLRFDISFCRFVQMLVRLRIWFEMASKFPVRTKAVDPLLALDIGVSNSRVGIDCRANIVADCGGVFSPRILCWCDLRKDGLIEDIGVDEGESRPFSRFEGVGVPWRLAVFSGGASKRNSLLKRGVEGRLYFSGELGFSGDGYFSGDWGDDDNRVPLSIKLLRSLTLDCMRLCPDPLELGRSGDASMRLGRGFVVYKLSRAFSVKAA